MSTREELAALRERLDALEARCAFADDALERLDAVVVAQREAIDALERRLGALAQAIRGQPPQAGGGGADERPPHD